MATPHTAAGDEDLRNYIQNNWTFIALIDDTGTEETRIDIANDSRASFTSGSASNPRTAEVTVEGGDSDITTPVTLAESELYKGSATADAMSGDVFAEGDATLSADADTLVVTHDIEQPEL